MTRPLAEIEQRALALFERLSDRPDDRRYRDRLLRREDDAVKRRVLDLERAMMRGALGALPTELPADLIERRPPPERIGPFRLVERVGEGGMGEVWQAARDDGLYHQHVAIKLIHPHVMRVGLEHFVNERRMLARLEHPNIARLIDGGVSENGTPFIIMEFIDGRPLDVVVEALPLKRRIHLFIKAADAVQFAHERLVVHADLKPSNIMVDVDGRVKLLDFGIAGLIGQGQEEGEAPSARPMTPAYASPARVAGIAPAVADDVYALGLILGTLTEGDGDADLSAIASKAQAAEEANRYGSVAALISDLERWREQLPVSARPDTWRYRAGKFFNRHRKGVAATVAAFLLLALAAVIATMNYARAEQERAEAAARFDDARGTARYLLFDLMDRLEAQPRSLRLRADVARVAQHYLDRLARAEAADQEVRLEAAAGLWRLAEHQAKTGRPNLRQPGAARANLDKAEAIAASIDSPRAVVLLARIRMDRAFLAANLDNDARTANLWLERARKILPKSIARDPSVEVRFLYTEANVLGWQGKYDAMIRISRKALALPPLADAKEGLLLRGALYDTLAEAEFYGLGANEAEPDYRTSMALLETAHARWPYDNYILGRLSRARWNLGTTLEEVQRFKESLPILANAIPEAQQALAFDPDDQNMVRNLKIIRSAYAQNLAYLGRIDDALPMLRELAEAERKHWLAHPDEPLRLRDYAMSIIMIGEAQSAAKRFADSCRSDSEALTLYRKLQAMGRLTQFDVQHNIELLRARMARSCNN